MILCNLAVLLSERGLTAQKVSIATGISRPTLTALTNNTGTGIQYDTINKLCNYLNVTPNELLCYIPYDFNLEFTWISPESELLVTISYFLRSKKQNVCNINISVETSFNEITDYEDEEETSSETICYIDITTAWDYNTYPDAYSNLDNEKKACNEFIKVWNTLPIIIKRKIESEIVEYICSSIVADHYEIEFLGLIP